MTSSTTKIYQTTFCKKYDVFSINSINIYLWFNSIFCMTEIIIQPCYVNLNIKVTNVANDRFILHATEMLFSDKVAATRSSYHYISFFHCVSHFLYFKAIHCSL